MSDSPTRRTRLGAAAGLVGATAAFTLVLGIGPAPSVFQLAGANEDVSGNCDEVEHAHDPECAGVVAPRASTSTTVDDSTTSSTIDDGTTSTTVGDDPSDPAPTVRTVDAAGAGAVVVSVEGNSLRLLAATPTAGWRVEVEQGSGREVEVDFRSRTKRVQVTLEIEDGQVREQVRVRDDADGTDVRREDGTVVRDDSGDDDHSSSGHGSDDTVDDHSSSGHGSDDSGDDDHSGSGHGSDDD
jgi:hypothetical protein